MRPMCGGHLGLTMPSERPVRDAGGNDMVGLHKSAVVSCVHCNFRITVYGATLEDLAHEVSVSLAQHLADSHPELHST